jgi:hypothetical protein
MAGIFGHPPNDVNNVLGGIRVQTSVFGQPIPIVYGRNRLTGNILDYFNFTATPQQHKGGKGGLFGSGGKGGQQAYDYAASILIGLCQGPIQQIGAVWDSQGTLPVNDTTEDYTIGGGLTYTATQQNTYIQDLGVTEELSYSLAVNDYGSPGAITISGTQQAPMKRVSGSPTTGEYSENGGVYTFAAADTGINVEINYSYGPPNSIDADPISSYNFSFFDGLQGQNPWGYLLTNLSSHALGYTLLAYVATAQLDLGDSGVLPNLSFEVYGLLPYGQGTWDSNPRDIIYDMMTNAIYGCGLEAIDVGSLSMANWAPSYSTYCIANGLFMSPVLNSSQTLSDYMKDWLDATNGAMIRNGLQLTVVSYGDTTTVGNGATFTPSTNPIYNLDDDDFIHDDGELPLLVERPSLKDAYNSVKVQFTERVSNYNTAQVEADYDYAIALYKFRPESARDYTFFTSQAPAAAAATTILNRLVTIRNKWKFKLPQTYILLDPMDLVVLPAVPETGNNLTPVRLTNISESGQSGPDSSGDPKRDDLVLEMEAEDFPWGNCGPTEYPKQPGVRAFPNANADPGYMSATPIIFEAVPRLRGTDPNMELWIGLCGNSLTVAFSGGGGSGATGYAIIVGGALARVVIVDGGTGYSTAPSVSFGNSQNLGSGATGTATVSGGAVTAVTISNGGSGYASAWGGARVWMSTDGSTYYPISVQFGSSIMGTTQNNYPAHSDPDASDNLLVDFSESGGSLSSFSAEHENQYASLSYIGNGGWGNIPYELLAFGQVTLISGNEYELLASVGGPVLSPYGPLAYLLQISSPGSGFSPGGGVTIPRAGTPFGPPIVIVAQGTNYLLGDVLTVSGGGTTFATIKINEIVGGGSGPGPAQSAVLMSGGAGYAALTTYTTTGGHGTGCAVQCSTTVGDCQVFVGLVSTNGIGAFGVAFGGSGYAVGDTGTIFNPVAGTTAPPNTEAGGTYTVSSVDTSGTYGELQSCYNPGVGLSVGGSGYAVGNVLMLGSGGAELIVLSLGAGGAVATATPVVGGHGYSVGVLYTCSGGAGTGCKLEVAQVNNGPGVITGLEISDPGTEFALANSTHLPYFYSTAAGFVAQPGINYTPPVGSPGSLQQGLGAGLKIYVTSLVNGAVRQASLNNSINAAPLIPPNYPLVGGDGYTSANGVSTSGGLALNIQAGSYVRRNVFGAPTGPSGGVAHPSGSPFLFIGAGPQSIAPLTKIKLDPSLVGQTVYFKFTSFNQRGNMEQSLATVPAFTYEPTGLQVGLYGFAYSVTPNILSQDATTNTMIDVAPFSISGSFGIVRFNGLQIANLIISALYNVYVYDPGLTGENGTLQTAAQYEARTDNTLSQAAGWFFIGQIQMQAAGSGTQTLTGGQSATTVPAQATQNQIFSEGMGADSSSGPSYYLNYTTLFNPLVPGSVSIAWATGVTITDDAAGHLVIGSVQCGTVVYQTGQLSIGPIATAAGSSNVPVSYRYY